MHRTDINELMAMLHDAWKSSLANYGAVNWPELAAAYGLETGACRGRLWRFSRDINAWKAANGKGTAPVDKVTTEIEDGVEAVHVARAAAEQAEKEKEKAAANAGESEGVVAAAAEGSGSAAGAEAHRAVTDEEILALADATDEEILGLSGVSVGDADDEDGFDSDATVSEVRGAAGGYGAEYKPVTDAELLGEESEMEVE